MFSRRMLIFVEVGFDVIRNPINMLNNTDFVKNDIEKPNVELNTYVHGR